MYQSRLHATNGIISIAVDALSGEVLEFVRESTWDNVTKNHVRQTWSLFDAIVHTPSGNKRLHAPRYLDVREHAELTPVITIDQQEKSAKVTIEFPGLVLHTSKDALLDNTSSPSGITPVDIKVGLPVDMSAKVTIELPENDCRSKWNMSLTNNTDWEIDTVNFPAVDGMWLGETWEDDVLVFPRFAGWQVVNPTKKLAADAQLEGERAVEAAFLDLSGDVVPVGNAVEGQQVQIVVPENLSVVIATAEIVVDVGAQQALAVERHHVGGMVVAHLMAGVPAEAHGGTVPERIHQRSEIFLSLGVFEGDLHAELLRFLNHLSVMFKTCLRRCMLIKPDHGMADHQRHTVLSTGMQAVRQLRNGGIGGFARLPHHSRLEKRRMDGLVDQTK